MSLYLGSVSLTAAFLNSMLIRLLLFTILLKPTRLKSRRIFEPTFQIWKSSLGANFDKKGIQLDAHSQ